jgi:hypothetical protein
MRDRHFGIYSCSIRKTPLKHALLKILSCVEGLREAAVVTSVAVFFCLCITVAHAETPESSTFAPTIPNTTPAAGPAPAGWCGFPAASFRWAPQ